MGGEGYETWQCEKESTGKNKEQGASLLGRNQERRDEKKERRKRSQNEVGQRISKNA